MNRHRRLDDSYLNWLYGQVCSVRSRDPSRSYRTLVEQLFRKEFLYLIPNDDNRAEDGKLLRYEFLEHRRIRNVNLDWLRIPCSMLEMLVGLSRRLSTQGGGEPREWFWHLIENLELDDFNDASPIPQREVDEVLERVIWRLYNENGRGGLFPLRRPSKDQRRVELWYQLNAYLFERIA